VCVRYGDAKGTTGRTCALMREAKTELVLADARTCPTWVLANDAAAGYYRVGYAGDLLQRALLGPGGKHLSLPERIAVIGDASALVDAGKMPPADAFKMVPKLLVDRNSHIVASTIDIVASVDAYLVPDALRPNYARFVRKTYGAQARSLGWAPKKGEDDDITLLRPELVELVAVQGEDARLIKEATALAEKWLTDRDAIAPDMVGVALTVAARHGGRPLYERFYAAAKETKDRSEKGRLMGAMASFTDPALVTANLEIMLGDEFEFREAAIFMQAPLGESRTRETAYQFIKDNFDKIMAKLPSFYSRYIVFVAAAFCDEAHVEDAKAFFTPKVKDMMGGPAALDQSVEQVRICNAQRTAQQASVETFLKRW